MMRSQTAKRHIISLIVLLMVGTTHVAAQGWGSGGKSPAISPPPGMDQQRRLQRPQRGRARQQQIPRRRAEHLQRMQERVNTMRMW
ncbi:MAG: hypothetical protein JSU61_02290, partial [Fidelibacterota bacterium]